MRRPARIRPAATSGARLHAQGLEAGPDPALGRAQRQIEEGGDLLVGQVFEEGQAERLALGRRQGIHGRPHGGAAMLAPDRLGGAGLGVRQVFRPRASRNPTSRGAFVRDDAAH